MSLMMNENGLDILKSHISTTFKQKLLSGQDFIMKHS